MKKIGLQLESQLKTQGFKYIIGVDEVGRGCLAGPVVAAAVHMPDKFNIVGIKDSKKISYKNREKLYERITTFCEYSIGIVLEETIDKINIRQATKLAMKRSILNMDNADFVLIDGDFVPQQLGICAKPVIGGDNISVSIAAASIVAKVFRDHVMEILHEKYPMYGWFSNKGYGTKKHRDAIKQHGPCKHHRKSFNGVKQYM